jgi:hypothetical protein
MTAFGEDWCKQAIVVVGTAALPFVPASTASAAVLWCLVFHLPDVIDDVSCYAFVC